jgi:hypothetical protein
LAYLVIRDQLALRLAGVIAPIKVGQLLAKTRIVLQDPLDLIVERVPLRIRRRLAILSRDGRLPRVEWFVCPFEATLGLFEAFI